MILPKAPIRTVTPKLLRDLRAVARAHGVRDEDLDDVVHDALVRTAKAMWDWVPSKAYLKRAVLSATEKFLARQRGISVDFQAIEAHDDDNDAWEVKALYYKRADEPLNDDEYADGDPLDLVDFLAMGFGVFEEPRALGDTEEEVLRLLTRPRPEVEAKELPTLEEILTAFSPQDRTLLEDRLCDQMSIRDLAAKYGLSKSTLQRRLKNLEKAFSEKTNDVLSKPSRQKKKKPRKSSGTPRVTEVEPISA
jgi:RNA polymerase sigma factor (sigma-70 family)